MKTAIASLGMGLGVIWATGLIQPKVNLSSTLGQLIEVGGGIAVGLLVYFVAAYLMGMEELELVLDLVKKKIKRRK